MPPTPTGPCPLPESFPAGFEDQIRRGELVPILGPGVLATVTHRDDGRHMPAESADLIIAMNNGRPMAPKLMYEFPRAAMNVELKRGRKAVQAFLERTYADDGWSEAPLHRWLTELAPPYVIDLNRDLGLQRLWATRPHILVLGAARIAGTAYRFNLYQHDGREYREIAQEQVDATLPVLFKPTGSALPSPSWIASDADYVDYLTELMGGFGIPDFLKKRRLGLRYATLGLHLARDTERMLLTDLMWGAAEPAGWAFIDSPTARERKYCKRMRLEIVGTEETIAA